MSIERRRDNRGRLLHQGEDQLPDGRYRFRYVDSFGERQAVYSWRLDHNDATPKGKKRMQSLREMEKQIQADFFDHIASNGGDLTVIELVEKYLETKINVRPTTRKGYGTVINILKKDPIGQKRIDQIKMSDAKVWLIKLQQKEGRGYSSIHSIRGVLRPAFQMAVNDDLIRKNPFEFELVEVVVNDSVRREAISREDERRFLKFIKEDEHFSKYYDGIYILFKTGMRISEFCGLTIYDIDFKEHTIRIDHQLLKDGSKGYYIQETKTEAGKRTIPMTPDVEECFRNLIVNRNPPKREKVVNGRTGFLFYDKNGNIEYSLHWEKYFKFAREKYNRIYKDELPVITPHVCRHTYCSNMAKSGMNPKTLQYLMGHASISVTLDVYTHVNLDDARAEITRLAIV